MVASSGVLKLDELLSRSLHQQEASGDYSDLEAGRHFPLEQYASDALQRCVVRDLQTPSAADNDRT